MKTLKQFINENTPVPISVAIGRFQPFHAGHYKMIEIMSQKPMILIVKGKGTSDDKNKNPLSAEDQERLIRKAVPNAEIRIVQNANLHAILFHLEKNGEYKVKEILAGDDRIESYKRLVAKTERVGVDVVLTPRVTSATKVREAIRSGDEATFKKLMPIQLHSEWDFLREKIN